MLLLDTLQSAASGRQPAVIPLDPLTFTLENRDGGSL